MNGSPPISLRVPVTPMVRKIMWANVIVYGITVFIVTVQPELLTDLGTLCLLEHRAVFGEWRIWTLFTYAWFHDIGPAIPSYRPLMSIAVCAGVAYGLYRLYESRFGRREFFLFLLIAFLAMGAVGHLGFGGPFHLLSNLIGLYFFGHLFEQKWGPRRFLWFWLLCTFFGGLLSTLMFYVWPAGAGDIALGASGGVLGLVAAFSIYYANQSVLFGLVVPIKGKHFLLVAIGFDLLNLMGNSGVAVFVHFGGIITGVLLCTGYWRPGKVMNRFGSSKKPHLRLVQPGDDDPPRYLH